MEHVEMRRPDGTCSRGAEDGLLRKRKTGEEKGRGREQRAKGEEEKKRVYAGAGKQARGEEAKAGEQTFRFGYYVFPCIFYFFSYLSCFILYDFYSVCWVASFGDYWFHI